MNWIELKRSCQREKIAAKQMSLWGGSVISLNVSAASFALFVYNKIIGRMVNVRKNRNGKNKFGTIVLKECVELPYKVQ